MTGLEQALKDWEAKFPMGRGVKYYPVFNRPEHRVTTVRSKPWALAHGDIVIAVEGMTGAVLVTHLENA
jgi:hypothetical protein